MTSSVNIVSPVGPKMCCMICKRHGACGNTTYDPGELVCDVTDSKQNGKESMEEFCKDKVIHRCGNEEDLNKTWIEYENGFGSLKEDFWLGNRYLHLLTKDKKYKMQAVVVDIRKRTGTRMYTSFSVSDAKNKYRLSLNGTGSTGNLTDELSAINGGMFSTVDQNNILGYPNCKVEEGFWYNKCDNPVKMQGTSKHWFNFVSPLTQTMMKIRLSTSYNEH
ncbi:fibrinogen-like protein 1 [Gigantopelta aegis]|uniref:fibrinogen-like protein 1 n=1 Tax=Gigantopelta aegis TaxID=1735272 RepID=UPI001B88DD69|nr:fibrinogen-like protein 1 [Gigantopelta aegis]